MNTDEGLSQFIFFMPPPATKQHECWTHETNWDLERCRKRCVRKKKILSQFWNLFPPDLTMKLTCWVGSLLLARPSPTKHYVRSTLELTWHLESWFKCHFLPLQQNNTLNKLRQFILSHFWTLRPPDPTQQHVKHVKKIGILSHFVDFVTVLLKALRSTYEPTWHPESCSKSILYSSKINTLNIRMNKVEMLICLEKNHPLPFQFIHWTHEEKLHLESFCNLQPLDGPYKIKPFAYRESLHVASVLKFTLLNATKIIVEHFGILPTPWPYKSIYSTYGSSWHVDSFYWIYLPCPLQNILFNVWISMASWLMLKCSLPSPTTKPCIEHMKKRNLESFLKFTAHRPYKTTRWTYGEISHVEWCLGFPSLRPCRTNGLRYEESCHAESFLKSTSPRPYLASTPFNKWTHLACWVIVKDLLPCALQKYTFKVVQQTNLFGILRRV